ncbi:MAG TPA: 6-phosphogluconolactonase [bacterium]|nr:6-phosphogluconolactonase [bacterium]HPN44341.1 6-phosphogluconolactonase [bacterium]
MEKQKFTNCHIYNDVNELSCAVAEQFVKLGNDSIQRHGRFTVALSGGSTPKILYNALVQHYNAAIDWSKVWFFWSDERYVQEDHPDSNAGMARQHLLQPLHIPEKNIYPAPTIHTDPVQAATEYENTIHRELPGSGIPRFELILLGLGDDGHTASLFPETAALHEQQRLVAANLVTKMSKWRITFTFPLLNSAKNIIFLVAGENKARVIHDILVNKKNYPATQICPFNGQLLWYLDKSAAGMILH